ncbi:MAG: prephenate dehydratase [Thermodesulfobium narugense]|nr:MAG: prephenate dehydratase [Thermodesulfobium narugense]
MKVGYLGPKGSYSGEALFKLNSLVDFEAVEISDFSTIFDMLQNRNIDYAIVPVENSIEGPVGIVLELMLKHDFVIQEETVLQIQNSLMALPDVRLSSIEKILSHPQPLSQCKNMIARLLPYARVISCSSTAEAAKLASFDPKSAAIGSPKNAELYKLEIILSSVSDEEYNFTRFFLLGRTNRPRTGFDKTSIACSTYRDRPGALFSILSEFAFRKINLTKIESRPSKRVLGDYIFFIDMIGHREDIHVKEALAALVDKTSFIKIFGSYPAFQEKNYSRS